MAKQKKKRNKQTLPQNELPQGGVVVVLGDEIVDAIADKACKKAKAGKPGKSDKSDKCDKCDKPGKADKSGKSGKKRKKAAKRARKQLKAEIRLEMERRFTDEYRQWIVLLVRDSDEMKPVALCNAPQGVPYEGPQVVPYGGPQGVPYEGPQGVRAVAHDPHARPYADPRKDSRIDPYADPPAYPHANPYAASRRTEEPTWSDDTFARDETIGSTEPLMAQSFATSGPIRPNEPNARERSILSYLAEHPTATQSQVSGELFMSRSTVADYTSSLQKKGLLVREGTRRSGRWVVNA